MTEHALVLQNITKTFGGIHALSDVGAVVSFGSVTSVVGDNGAGKSTLLKIASGVEQPDSGDILVRGESMRLRSPQDAEAAGIGVVHQDLGLVPGLAIWQNLFLGREQVAGNGALRGIGVLRRQKMIREARDVLDDFGIRIPAGAITRPVAALSGGQRQAIAICRAAHDGHNILLLDEPTAALGLIEAERTIATIESLKARGLAILLISHNFEDVCDVSDRVLVLRAGREIGRLEGTEVRQEHIVEILKGKRDAATAPSA
ncbi:ATP-binding cassette domain-containing protein [Salinibacterium sp. ZJ454]|uniref:ATP-binding cassette domain-containing protein n=1 Tax=Salinibacterium sp. ZJ454 TaxID=2708339 RepID=UPI00141DA8DF|nr:ATP-binding cassette domain-containing protein [Salinibacterium sp. ZJ454]